MINNEKAPNNEGNKMISIDNSIVACSYSNSFMYKDWLNSGISLETINQYINNKYLKEDSEGWTLNYPDFLTESQSSYFTKRIKNPKNGVGKYIRTANEQSHIFRPLNLHPDFVQDIEIPLIITEGEKKAIKAVQEGFPCVSLGGVYCWKTKPNNETNEEDIYDCDIIEDLKNINFKNKEILLCFDNDMWEKPQVKMALYQLSAYLISEKSAKVKIIELPKNSSKINEKLGLDDYLVKYSNVEFEQLINSSREITLKEIQQELSGMNTTNISFPLEIFEPNLKNLLQELAERHDAPKEYIGACMIAFASVVMLGKYSILVDSKKNWIDNPIIWLSIVGNPSQKKTPVLKIFKDIIDEYDNNLKNMYEKEMQDFKVKYQQYKKELKLYENNKTGILPDEPIEPIKQRLTTQNSTVEALLKATQKNQKIGRYVSIVVDELTTLLKSFNQYKGNNGSDLEHYLQSWKAQQINIIRQQNNLDYTISVAHSIIGTIQPKVLDKTIFADGIESTNGMIERWLFALSKSQETGKEYMGTNPYDTSLIKNIFDELYNYNGETRQYRFDSEAQKLFNDFCRAIIKQKKDDKNTDLIKNYLQKQTDYVARFSLILHCLKNPKNLIINSETVKKAIRLSAYFIGTFETITLQLFNTIPISEQALNYIRTRGIKSVSPTVLYKSNMSLYKNSEKARIALESLANRGYGRFYKKNKGYTFIVY